MTLPVSGLPLSAVLASAEELRTVYRQPIDGAVRKEIDRLDAHCRRFIGLSPFLCIGTMSADGRADVSPRGGEPGFVHVLDDYHLAIPDRPGNNRLDSFTNIVRQPSVGLLFFVPGFEDMLRVNGTARISTDEALMVRFLFDGKPPRSVIVVDVKEAQHHCAKAVKRARLWDPAAQVPRSSFPSAGEILRDTLALDRSVADVNAYVEKDARDNLY